jgi:hexosaminidase
MKNIYLFLLFVLLSANVFSQLVLCSFETEPDVAAVKPGAGVRITRTEQYAALNAHALQAIFPAKGGSITVQEFKVPSWSSALGSENTPADALLLFVWSEKPAAMNIGVQDSSSASATESFSLRAGANHLQLSFARLAKINTAKIKSLTISCSTEATIYVDYIALDQHQDVLVNNGRWDVPYTNKIPTSHFPWGRNFINGKINTYSISPVFDGRGIIELSERLDIDYKVTTVGRDPGINRWGFGDFYNRRNPLGDDGEHSYSLAFNYIADDLLTSSPFDVIIWPGIHPWESYPQYIRDSIMKRVENGTGLVLLYPSGKSTGNFQELSPLTLDPAMSTDSIDALKRRNFGPWQLMDTTSWQRTQEHYITQGVALDVFPFGSIGVLPFVNNGGEVLLKTAKGNPVMAVKNYGKGRVVAMAYEESGFLPKVKDPWSTGLHNDYWEYMWSMVSRAVVWAAKRVPESSISNAVFRDSSIDVYLQNARKGDSLCAQIEDEYGVIEKKFSIVLQDQKAVARISQLNALHGGGHIVNMSLIRGNKVSDWYSLQINTARRASIVSISSDKEEVPAGQPVQCTVRLKSDKAFQGELTANLYDNYNRLVSRKSVNVRFSDTGSYVFDLDSKNIISHLGKVEFVLTDSIRQTDRKTKEIFFLQARKWDDYDVTLYHFGPDPVPGTWAAIDSQLQRMQVTTLAAYTLEQSRHANYKVQAQTRISGMESPDNGPDLNYYDSIKKQYLATGDKKILARKYGLNDSSFLHSVKAELNRMVPQWRKFSPSAYYIYEEPSVTRYDDALDLDFSETALAAFRKWLQEKYTSLEPLNLQWGTAFKKWEEVVPDDTKEAQKRGNYSSWADHRSFMERSWADQFRYVQDALHEIDPGGLVQLSGTQASGAHNGYDYSLLDKYVGQMNPYDIGNQLEYHHDFNPALKISGQAGYGASGKSVLYDFYQHIFVNETGGAYVFWQQSALNPDLTFCKSGQDMQSGFTEMLDKGIGRLVANYTPENENSIAIHYSYPSIHAAWIVDGKIKPGQTYGNTSETLEQFRRNLDGWVKVLQDAGLGFDFTSYGNIENGDLLTKKYKVLILPMSAALSSKEASAIEAFVKNGGIVITDALPGIMDDHAKFRKTPALANVFGIAANSYSAKDLITPVSDNRFTLKGATSLTSSKKSNRLLVHPFGKGRAFMLNYFLDHYAEQKATHMNDSALAEMRILFDAAGIRPTINFTKPDGGPLSGISKYSFVASGGQSHLLGILPDKNTSEGNVLIHLDTLMHVYDIRHNVYLGKGKERTIGSVPLVPVLLALLPGTINSLRVEPLSPVRPGEKVRIHFALDVSDSMKLRSVANIYVIDPSGKKLRYYGGNSNIDNNKGEFEFQTALNDLTGQWKVVVREVISGKSVTRELKVRSAVELVLPVPQHSDLSGRKFSLSGKWTIRGNSLDKNNTARISLQEQVMEQYKLKLPVTGQQQRNTISLVISEGAVQIPPATDTNHTALMRQAYRLELRETNITITANAAQGLYYGVQSLVQLLEGNSGQVSFPEGELEDWPEMDLRMIYWDDAHHLEKFDVLKREIRKASLYKINAFSLKLEGHFQFASAAPMVEPYALSAAQYQELTDYAARYYVQLVPYLDAPAHVSFILKHPEYKSLRAFPNSNYQLTVNNPGTYKLMSSMFRDLINANKGVDYVLLSNDEAYYTGKAANEIDSAKALGGNGKLLAQFIGRMADTLKQYGRKVIFWGEYPLVPDDIQKLPRHMINGVYDSSWAGYFKQRGIRQLIYTSTQGEEPLFPNYYPLKEGETLHPENARISARVPDLLNTVSQAVSQKKADLSGVIVAGWADAGLHPETFWLGYATGASLGWNHDASAQELTNRFYHNFYGGDIDSLKRIYELTSRQAQFYEDSWEWSPSTARTPIFGNSEKVYDIPKLALDQRLAPLPIPDANRFLLPYNWLDSNAKRLGLAKIFKKENDELMALLNTGASVRSNKYNLDVIRSVAMICRQNISMFSGLEKINQLMVLAGSLSGSEPDKAVRLIDQALDVAASIRTDRNNALDSTVTTWYRDWLPLVAQANGRKYLHAFDDVKDHRPLRTADMSYLIYRELLYPLGKWAAETLVARNDFARQHKIGIRTFNLQWEKY